MEVSMSKILIQGSAMGEVRQLCNLYADLKSPEQKGGCL